MLELWSYIHSFLMSAELLLICKISAFIIQTYILVAIIKHFLTKNTKIVWFLIALILISTLILDANWILKLANKTKITEIPFAYLALFCQVGYPFDIIRYIACIGFLDILIQKKSSLNLSWFYRASIATLTSIITLFVYEYVYYSDPLTYSRVLSVIYPILYFYLIAVFIPATILIAYTSTKIALPTILHYQMHIILYYVVTPYTILEVLTTNPFTLFTHTPLRSNYFFISISTIHLAATLYYCIKKMALLRFLNIKQQVIAIHAFTFIKNFKNILDTLHHATTEAELIKVAQEFFQTSFSLPANTVQLVIRDHETTDSTIIEQFLTITATSHLKNYIASTKILLYDELEFTLFYDNDPLPTEAFSFLQKIDASLFLPLYKKQTIIGYITLPRTGISNLFTNVDQDEMILFAEYLAATINTLRTKTINTLIKKNKELTEELYTKNQEINQHKESIRSFIKTLSEKNIGILFYKNQTFSYGNHAAKILIPHNLNDSPLLKKLAQSTLTYKQAQAISLQDHSNTLMINAIPSLEANQVILTAHYPEITDILTAQKHLLKDPSHLDYLVYLETTQSGQLINQLIPGSNELLLNFKINLLHMALSKKAVLLDMAAEDLMPAVEILHHISLRSTLEIMHITAPERDTEYALKLFGANPLFNLPESSALLEKLHDNGTLFIKNIHLLSYATQEILADYLTYGFFYNIKSTKKIICNVRIICAILDTSHRIPLHPKLFKQLETTTISLPPLKTLTTANSATPAPDISINEFKNMIHEQVTNNALYKTIHHSTGEAILDPDITAVVKLGKKALKNKESMILLWNTFKNQSKIATLLGVNRSSVHRRYNTYFTTESCHDKSRISSKNNTLPHPP